MTQTTLYLDADEFSDRIGPAAMRLLFDDDGSGTINTQARDRVLLAASRRTTATLARIYGGPIPFPPDQVPDMAVELTWEWAMAFAHPRNPDYMKAIGMSYEKCVARAQEIEKQLRSEFLRLSDAPSPVPANAGGEVSSMAADENFPDPPNPKFDNLGFF